MTLGKDLLFWRHSEWSLKSFTRNPYGIFFGRKFKKCRESCYWKSRLRAPLPLASVFGWKIRRKETLLLLTGVVRRGKHKYREL